MRRHEEAAVRYCGLRACARIVVIAAIGAVLAATGSVQAARATKTVWNGTSATSEASWSVRLSYTTPKKKPDSCTGSIISRHYILTAAHCTGTNFIVIGNTATGPFLFNASNPVVAGG